MRRVLLTALLLAGLAPACRRGTALRVAPTDTNPAEAFPASADPALAADPETGDLLLAFVAGSDSAGWRLYFTRSSDRGASWRPPVAVTTDPHEVHPHGEASPRLVASPGGRVALVWSRNLVVPGRKWPASLMRFARSVDGGTGWSHPLTINDDSTGAPIGHTFHGATLVGDSGLLVAWLDERDRPPAAAPGDGGHAHDETAGSDARIYAVSSTDFGAAWTPNRRLWGAVCPCCRVTLATGPDGAPLAAWRRRYPGNIRDIVVARVAAAGQEPIRVREDNWVYPGCPHSGPGLSMDRNGSAHVAWYTGREGAAGVFLARSDTALAFAEPVALLRGERLPAAHPAVLALAPASSLVAWDIDPTGARRLLIARVDAGEMPAPVAVPGTEGASYPQLAAGSGGTLFLAWTQLVGETLRVRLARIDGS